MTSAPEEPAGYKRRKLGASWGKTPFQPQAGPSGCVTKARPCPSLGLALLCILWTSTGSFNLYVLATEPSVQIKYERNVLVDLRDWAWG